MDSRLATSGDSNNFTWELPEVVTTTPRTVAWVVECCLPVSWPTVTVFNRYVYLMESKTALGVAQYSKNRILTLPLGVYTLPSLASALQTALNDNTKQLSEATYVVQYLNTSNQFQVTLASTSALQTGEFAFVDDTLLRNPEWYAGYWANPSFNIGFTPYRPYEPCSANSLIGIRKSASTITSPGIPQGQTHWTSSISDIRSMDAVFLTSSALSGHSSIAPNGGRSVLKKVSVSTVYGTAVTEG